MNYNLNDICEKLEKNGYCLIDKFWDKKLDLEIENFFNHNIKPLEKKTKIDEYGNRCFSIADNEIENNPFNKIKESKEFKNIYKKILKYNNIEINDDLDIHNVISYQKNEKNLNLNLSSKLHFDAFYLTIIITIKKSVNDTKGSTGSLILYPNIRKKSSNSINNYLIKIMFQNLFTRWILNLSFFKKKLKAITITGQDNKVLLFYGYRSLHGNEALKNYNLKVNAIFHIFNPHKKSKLDNFIFNRNKKIRNNKLNY